MGFQTDSSSDCASHDHVESGPETTFKCNHCDASFSKNSKLLHHTRLHTGERPYRCDESQCLKTYTNSSHLKRHKRTAHVKQEGDRDRDSIVCPHDDCCFIFANKYSLKKHESRHHNPARGFKCGDCSQIFHRKKHLQHHVYLHTGVPTFMCDKCPRSFITTSDLNRHKKRHRTYTCDCGEVFERWTEVRAHRKTCRKQTFECEVCQREFSIRFNYKNHLKTHQDDKNLFFCPVGNCERFYLYKRNLTFHIRQRHEKNAEAERLPCTHCAETFKNRCTLKKHVALKHFRFTTRKTPRKPRKDKGTKKEMAATLSGLDSKKTKISETGSVDDIIDINQCEIIFKDNEVP